MITEVWKDVEGTNGKYQISNTGKLRSMWYCGKVFLYSKELKPGVKSGLFYVHMRRNGKRSHYFIHKLVAEAFLPKPSYCNIVQHIDGNKQNNCVNNLKWAIRKSPNKQQL